MEETEDSKSACTVTDAAAQRLTCSEPRAGSSHPYLSPSPSPTGHRQPDSSPEAGDVVTPSATTITPTTASPSTSHCLTAIPAASSASPAVPVPPHSPDVSVAVIHAECNTNHVPEASADAMVRSPVQLRLDPQSPESGSPELQDDRPDVVNRVEEELGTRLESGRRKEVGEAVNKCSTIEDEDEEAMDSPVDGQEDGPCLKSSTGSSGESVSPDRDSSLRSCTSPSSSTTARTHQQSQDSPADSPTHEMQLLCNTSVRHSDSPLHEQNTSPSHHSADSGIASSASQQDTDPQPVLRQAIDCNNSPAGDTTDRRLDGQRDECLQDEASLSSDSSSPPLSLSSSRQTGVFKFSSIVSKPVPTVAPVVQTTTSPIVAHKEDVTPVVAVNGSSHSKCSDDDSSCSSVSPPPHCVPVKRPADLVSRSDQPDTTPDLCFNDGETRTVRVLPEAPSIRRQNHSVASGDHNYISVIDGRDGQQNHRNHSASRPEESLLSNHRIDQNHSDLRTRPNKRRKCSSSTSSDNIHTMGLESGVRNNSTNSNNNSTSGSSSGSGSSGRGSGDQNSHCSESAVDSASLRNSCKFPIMNGHTYEV